MVVSICEPMHPVDMSLISYSCFQIRDRQISMALLTPMAINDLDCDIEDLCSRDFVGESEETAEYLIAQAKLSRIGKVHVHRIFAS